MNVGMKKHIRNSNKNLELRKKENGFIYLIRAEVDEKNIYKIGYSKDPVVRIKQLQREVDNCLELLHMIKTNDVKSVEKIMHTLFRFKNITYRKKGSSEWFKLLENDVIWFNSTSEYNVNFENKVDAYGSALKKLYSSYYLSCGKSCRKEANTKKEISFFEENTNGAKMKKTLRKKIS